MMPDTIRAATTNAFRDHRGYAALRERHAAVGPYPDVESLLEALRPASSTDGVTRAALVAALLAAHQGGEGKLPEALLLAAFEPMLVRLRVRLGGQSEDTDQMLLVAFLGALRAVRPERFAALAIRGAVLDAVKAHIRGERRHRGVLSFDEETYAEDLFGLGQIDKMAAAEVTSIALARGGEELLGALLATAATSETLASYVRRTRPNESEQARANAYERLRLAHQKVLAEVRAKLAA
jgi:hypothetical protein